MKDYLRQSTALQRGTVIKGDDDPKMQGLNIRGMNGESYQGVEFVESYGFSAVPMPPANPKDKQTAEVLMAFVKGDPAHPVVIAAADRRHRPTKRKPGEVSVYDHQGQGLRLSEDGAVTLDAGKTLKITAGGVSITLGDGKIILDGDVYLGGEGGAKKIATEDTLDSGGGKLKPPFATRAKAK